jgi:peptidoglycan/xylan/chitin deacetylase (PgdA/CDA1 family)
VWDQPHPIVDLLGVRTTPDVFLSHIRYFARSFDLVSVADVVSGRLPRRPLLVTFDDAYRSVLDVAGPILREYQAPSVFFLNSGTVRGQRLPIDNLLSLAVSSFGFDSVRAKLRLRAAASSAVDLLADHVASLDRDGADRLEHELLDILGVTAAEVWSRSGIFMDAEAVRGLSAFRIEVGNHSMHHRFFRSLPRELLRHEIRESQLALERMSGAPVVSLSIPYGNRLDATDDALEIARSSGHRAIFLVHGRSNSFRPDPDVFYRTNPGSVTPAMMPWRLQVAPMLRTAASWVR